MLKTAVIVVDKYQGIFPSTYNELIGLPGIGDYTASAISSICKNEVQPVVDGNVLRFLSRLYKVDLAIDSVKTKKYFKNLGFQLIKDVNPGDFNQAMMDFGSTVCKPRKSDCFDCIFSTDCKAYNTDSVMLYPIKKKKIKIKERYLNYVVVITKDKKTRIKKRNDSGIWKNLYEFPLIETETEISADEIIDKLDIKFLKLYDIKKTKHKLSHQLLHITFFMFMVSDVLDDFISIESLNKYPFPKPINNFISELVWLFFYLYLSNMSGSLNKVMLIGNLGDDVKMHQFEDGGSIGRFPIATNESYTNKQTGEKVDNTEWHNIIVRNKAAEICNKYLKKGDKVYVEGKLKTRKWQGEDGIQRYTTEVHVTEFNFLNNKADSNESPKPPTPNVSEQQANTDNSKSQVDDLPF